MGYGLVDAYQAVLRAQQTECARDLTISQNVGAGQEDNQSAANSIIARNTISNNARASYDAGFEVTLSPNFDAALGSSFDAFIEGCSDQNVSRTTQALDIVSYDFIENGQKTAENQEKMIEANEFTIYPNPSNGLITVDFPYKDGSSYSLEIYDQSGRKILSQKNINSTNNVIDLKEFQKGILFH